jgi:DNA replication and repair protein RecF
MGRRRSTMYIEQLSLQDFRNYPRLDIAFPCGLLLFTGGNAQGKSNLLEAIYLLATTRSVRATGEGELVNWEAARQGPAVARLVGTARRHGGSVQVEVAIMARPRDADARSGHGLQSRLPASKRLRVNGIVRRASETVGQVTAVLFTTQDIDLIGGAPALRRRYLDITLSQVDPAYLRALQRYGKIVLQRNALLRRIQEGAAGLDQLSFWDDEMAREGAYIIGSRGRAVASLAVLARETHRALSGGEEDLSLVYQPQLSRTWDDERVAATSVEELASILRQALLSGRQRDVAVGVSLTGPHRDDLLFLLDGMSAAAFASRGQQRTAALALRLAEARFLLDRSGEHPILLLDDVLSELDETRRKGILAAASEFEQVLITSVDADRFNVADAHLYRVVAGQVEPLTRADSGGER